MARVHYTQLQPDQRPLVYEAVAKLREARRAACADYDREIARLDQMLETGLVPQTCDYPPGRRGE